MATTPQPLADFRRYLATVTPREAKFFSIARDCSEGTCEGYHLGRDQIYGPGGRGDADYSIQHPRDKAGLTNARSAIDINLGVRRLVRLNEFLEAEGKAGRLRDMAEFIGPGPGGRAYRWAPPAWAPAIRERGDDHEWHDHVGFRRDSEKRDKIGMFEGFFGPRSIPDIPSEPLPALELAAEEIRELQRVLNLLRVRDQDGKPLVEDGMWGTRSDFALAAAAAHVEAMIADRRATEGLLEEAVGDVGRRDVALEAIEKQAREARGA